MQILKYNHEYQNRGHSKKNIYMSEASPVYIFFGHRHRTEAEEQRRSKYLASIDNCSSS